MAITPEQLEQRRHFLGGSDIAALFTDDDGKSLNPFATAVDVWTSKVFELAPERNQSDAIDIGNRYEPVLRQFAAGELGTFIEDNPDKLRFVNTSILGSDGKPIFAANLDGYTSPPPPEDVEIKTTGMSGEWGEPGTDDVPFRVILQVHHQMLCSGMNTAHIAVLIGRWGLKEEMFRVERNEDIISAIIERGTQFWNDFVLTKTPPPETEKGNIKVFKRIIRKPLKVAQIDPELITTWETLRQERLAAQKAEKAAQAELFAELGDAEAAPIDGERELTYLEQRGADNIDRKALQQNHPDVYAEVATESRHRVARIRKIKRG